VLHQSGGGVAGAINFVGSPKTMEFGKDPPGPRSGL